METCAEEHGERTRKGREMTQNEAETRMGMWATKLEKEGSSTTMETQDKKVNERKENVHIYKTIGRNMQQT